MSGEQQPNLDEPRNLRLGPRAWAVVVAVGVLVGLASAGLMAFLRLVEHQAWGYAQGTFLDGVRAVPAARRVATLAFAGVLGGITMWAIRRASGWRRVEVNQRIWRGSDRLPVVEGAAVSMVSMALVGLGESLGRERSAKQAGAIAGSVLSRLAGLREVEGRVLVALGSAAGMGAVYDMPVGGALFGLEVLLGAFSLPLATAALALGGIATLVSWIVLPARPTYHVPAYALSGSQLAFAALAGPVLGAASAAYVRLVLAAHAGKELRNGLLVAPVLAFGALGALAIRWPELLGNGKDVVQLAFAGEVGVGLALALVVLKPLAVAGCLRAGMPGGLFTPTLTYGALLGTLLGAAWSAAWPGTPAGVYAIVGAGATIAAATQGPVSAIVMMLELTWTIDPIVVPLAIATAGATAVSKALLPRSIYSG